MISVQVEEPKQPHHFTRSTTRSADVVPDSTEGAIGIQWSTTIKKTQH